MLFLLFPFFLLFFVCFETQQLERQVQYYSPFPFFYFIIIFSF